MKLALKRTLISSTASQLLLTCFNNLGAIPKFDRHGESVATSQLDTSLSAIV